MPRQETILSVFVASPSDVDEERNRLEDVIREFNKLWSRQLGIRLELIRWETDAYPSFGEDPQSVINAQIPEDFDLFIGIMWYRFGTRTARAGSGTVEEFRRAKDRYDADPDSLQIMIYFKDSPAPVSPTQLDADQLAEVSGFRSGLGKEGGLYWTFQTPEDFEQLVRIHLTKYIQAWQSRNDISQPLAASAEEPTTTEQTLEQSEDEEVGLLDLVEQFEDGFSTVQEITERIASATEEIGDKMNARAEEMSAFASGPDSDNPRAAKRLISNAAGDMDQYVHRIESELPLFSQHLDAGLGALTQAAALSIDYNFEREDLEQAKETLETVSMLRKTMNDTEVQLEYFRQTVASLPRMTTALNRSRRAMVNVIERLIDDLRGGQLMLQEAEATFASSINGKIPIAKKPNGTIELSTDQVNILKQLAFFEGNTVTAETLAHSMSENVTRVKYHLAKLVEGENVYDSLSMGSQPEYSIADRGREYLVEHDLL